MEHFHDLGRPLATSSSAFVTATSTGTVRYTGPDADVVPELVTSLCDHLNSARLSEPMVDAAIAHLNLVKIHPFKDGNGRMSRILQTLVLARGGIVGPEFASIEEYLGNYTQGYYDILNQVGTDRWAPEQDALPWIRYCLTAHHIQSHNVRSRIRRAERLWELLDDAVNTAGVAARAVGGIHDATLDKKVTNSSYRAGVKSSEGEEIGNKTASTDLNSLVAGGLLEPRRAGRSAHYVAKLMGLVASAIDEFAARPIPKPF